MSLFPKVESFTDAFSCLSALLYPANTIPYVTYSLGLAFFRPTPTVEARNFNEHLPPSHRARCALLAAAYFGRTFISISSPSLASSSFKAPAVIDRNYFEPGCPILKEISTYSVSVDDLTSATETVMYRAIHPIFHYILLWL